MTRAEPTTGVVLNADGTPAQNAKFLLQYESRSFGPHSSTSYFHNARVMATTDGSGRFTLDQLASSAQYLFVVETADSARMLVHDLRAGLQDVELQAPERQDLHVRIIGDLSRLQKRKGKPFIMVRQDVEVEKNSRHTALIGEDVFVTPTEEGGTAEYLGLVPGTVTVTAGNHYETFDVADAGTTEVTVRLGKQSDR
jgi:hypothetical protein